MSKFRKCLIYAYFLGMTSTTINAKETNLEGNMSFEEKNTTVDSDSDKETEELKNSLFNQKENISKKIDDETIKTSFEFSEKYKNFLNECKTERECVDFFVNEALSNGFTEFDSSKKYNPGDKVYRVNRNKSVVFAVIGNQGSKNGFNIVVSHIDSPRLDLKTNPLYEDAELAWLKSHYYGGIKKYQWTTIPLSLHGKIILKDGKNLTVRIGENDNDPCFYVSDLLPHLAHDQMSQPMSKVINGEKLNILIGSLPLKSGKGSDLVKLNILNILNKQYGITENDFCFAELELVPAFKSRDIGFDRSMVGGYGQDDRSCAFCAFNSCMSIDSPEKTAVVMLADKEEIGSDGNTGMQSRFYEDFMADLADNDGVKPRHAFSKSRALSADVDAAYDPNYPEVFDSMNSSYLGRGVVVTKYTGSGGKYSSSDASSEYLSDLRKIFDSESVLYQFGNLGKVDTGGGGTVAKYVANLNIDVVDVGVPVMSMHSPFEVTSKLDLYQMYKAALALLKH